MLSKKKKKKYIQKYAEFHLKFYQQEFTNVHLPVGIFSSLHLKTPLLELKQQQQKNVSYNSPFWQSALSDVTNCFFLVLLRVSKRHTAWSLLSSLKLTICFLVFVPLRICGRSSKALVSAGSAQRVLILHRHPSRYVKVHFKQR